MLTLLFRCGLPFLSSFGEDSNPHSGWAGNRGSVTVMTKHLWNIDTNFLRKPAACIGTTAKFLRKQPLLLIDVLALTESARLFCSLECGLDASRNRVVAHRALVTFLIPDDRPIFTKFTLFSPLVNESRLDVWYFRGCIWIFKYFNLYHCRDV